MHNVVDSNPSRAYDHVLFCTWCGTVFWHFNFSKESNERLQAKIGEPCIRNSKVREPIL